MKVLHYYLTLTIRIIYCYTIATRYFGYQQLFCCIKNILQNLVLQYATIKTL